MNGPGRIRARTRRAFIAAGDRLVTTRELMAWIWPRRSTFRRVHYDRARRAAREAAEPVGYLRRGRNSKAPGGLLWRAVGPVEPAKPRRPMTGRLWWMTEGASAETD
jgi:hypothetical protein